MAEEAEFQQYAHDPALRRNAGLGLGPAARRGIFGEPPGRSFFDPEVLKKILVGDTSPTKKEKDEEPKGKGQ